MLTRFLKEGNLLSNVFNRAIRSCFYTAQKYYDGKIPIGAVSPDILEDSQKTILEYEKFMYKCEFHSIMSLLDTYLRNINKYWANNIRQADQNNDANLRTRTLINAFHMVRTATILAHPIAPKGTEMVREYLKLDDSFGIGTIFSILSMILWLIHLIISSSSWSQELTFL